jgi:maleylacetoacetate isomerase/maleylpyruvate isomerase
MSRLVPLLALDDAAEPTYLSQSMAIIEYLDESHPEPPLMPATPLERAQVRAIAQDIACDIHPLNNTRVLRYLQRDLGQDQATVDRWYQHWIALGLQVVERRLRSTAGKFCFGDQPGLADCLLVPQIFNAKRFNCPLDDLPEVMRVFGNCMALDAFAKTQPSACPDAQG